MIPLFLIDIAVFFCIYLIISLTLNFQQGVSGIYNLGLFLPVIIGAAVVAYLPGRLAMMIYGLNNCDFIRDNALVLNLLRSHLQGDPFMSISLLLLTIVFAMAICAVVGFLLTPLILRLSGTYQAVFLLCLAEALRVIMMQTDEIAGGVMGVSIPTLFYWMGPYSYLGLFIFIAITTTCVYMLYGRLVDSPLGILLRAIRENEIATECLGKNVPAIKRKVLTLSFSILGLAGVLSALYLGAVVMPGYNRTDFSFYPWLMMIVGGTGNNLGVALGTLLVVLWRRGMMFLKYSFYYLPFSVMWIEPILIAVALAITLLFRPSGLLPEKPRHIKLD